MSAPATTRRDRAFFAVLALLLAVGLVTALTRGTERGATETTANPEAPSTFGDAGTAALAALRYRGGNDERYERLAADGFSHPLFAQVPGGAVATARRVARWRPLIDRVAEAQDSPVDADLLEALVYLESAGRPDAAASGRARDAVGLTQIVAGTGTQLLGMRIDVERSDALTEDIRELRGKISRWSARGSTSAEARGRRQLEAMLARRRAVDPRYDPAEALAGTIRYLKFARGELERDDLALTSYHMGVGNLQGVLAAYGRSSVPYAQLYFDVDPRRSPRAYARLSEFADDSATYYWRLLAAKQIMAMARNDMNGLAEKAELMTRKASREDWMHPPADNPPYRDPAAIRSAIDDGELLRLPIPALNANGLAVSPAMGELAGRLEVPESRYRALRRGPLATLVTIGAAVKELTGDQSVLTVTSTVRDTRYQALLVRTNREATRAASLHASGWAMDIARSYGSRREAAMFQFVLTRMQALDLITWVREPEAIHLTVTPDADDRLGPILQVALGRS